MEQDASALVAAAGRIGPLVAGEVIDTGARLDVLCPSTGTAFTSVSTASPELVSRAVADGEQVFRSGIWSRQDARARGRALRRFGDVVAGQLDLLAGLDALCTGRPISEMRPQISRLPEWFHYYAGLLESMEGAVPPFGSGFLNYVTREPLGVVAQVVTWNHPLLLLVKKLAPALAMGNSVVVKPSELTPITSVVLGRLALEAGIPPGVVNVVPGDGPEAGAVLVADPRLGKVDFTGGTETGRAIAVAAARNLVPSTMELGGKAPVVVYGDADLDRALAGSLFAAFVASGQTCVSGTRFLVQRSVFEEFSERFAAAASTLRLGLPLDPRTQMGPVISAAQQRRVLAAVDAAREGGATVLAGGGVPDLPGELAHGFFIEPTVVTGVTREMALQREEIFGPAVSVTPFDDEEDAVAAANDSVYGLGAAVWTRDLGRAHRTAQAIRAGVVWVNDHHKNDPSSPWGGFGLSGYGRENGEESLHAYSATKSVVVNLADTSPAWFADSAEPKRYG
jgi:acyl-CoA reductase-like NAD-dependent aldehyde dehydrogenase